MDGVGDGTDGRPREVKKVLFVCTANICRSPAAEAIFNALTGDRGMDLRADSAGVSALEGRRISAETAAALEEIGIYAGGHRASQMSRAMIEDADLVLTMNERQVEKIRALPGSIPEYVHVLPEYAPGISASGIPDPYGYTMSAHRATVRLLLECVEAILGMVEE